MKRSFKVLFWTVSGIIGFLLVYIIAVLLLSRIAVNNNAFQQPKEVEIFLLSNGVHTDIVVPLQNEVKDWSESVRIENTKAKDFSAKYVAFGWGDKGFYLETPTWADLKMSTALKAATGLSSSAIHTTFYKNMREDESCKKILISKENYAKLVSYIEASFQIKNERLLQIATNYTYGNNDAFYEAKGSYSLFYTCNTWANSALKAARQKASLWTVYDKGIFYHYQ
ncbi:urease-associated protein [Flavobacterium cauense R2A-7]|nr:urease-associated protein [Flavobacterium cauense R2A-7]